MIVPLVVRLSDLCSVCAPPSGVVLSAIQTERRIELTNLPENWSAVIGLAVLATLCWWVLRTYRAEARAGSTLGGRMFLAGLRCAVLLLLALIWLEPVLATYLHQKMESYTLVLVDGSSSIDISDYYATAEEKKVLAEFFAGLGQGEIPPAPHHRAELVKLLLHGRDSAFLRELTRRNRVKIFTFADRTTEIATLAAQRAGAGQDDIADTTTLPARGFELRHTGKATNLGQTLRQAVDSVKGAIAAVVVISDGAFNQGEAVEVLGEFGRARGIAIHTIGIGESPPLRNISVPEMLAPANVLINDPFELRTRIRVSGMEDEAVTVELLARPLDTASREPVVVAQRIVQTQPGVTEYPLSFQHRASVAGRSAFSIRASVGVPESITEDNTASAYINFLDDKMKVLLLAGGPSWTYRFVSRLLERDKTFDLSCWLQSADRVAVRDGNTVIDHLPDTADELFEYDVLILLDPDARRLPAGWADLVDRHVTRNGAGLMYCAARKNTPAFFHDASAEPLIRLLPVVPHTEADLILNEVGYFQRRSSSIELPRTALDHPIFAAAASDSADFRSADVLLKQLFQVYWHYPVRHEKAAAIVLMRHGHPRMRNSAGGHVLLAMQFVGTGRATYLGFDGTWRWRRYGEGLFDQFWVQNVRYLAEGRLFGQQGRGRIHTDRDRYDIDEPIVFRAKLSDRDYEPLTEPTVPLRITVDGDRSSAAEILLIKSPTRIGGYEAQFVPRVAGRYVASVRLEDETSGESVVMTHEIDVRRPNLEIIRPHKDRDRLIALAERSAGGAYFEVNQALALPGRIPDRHEIRITKGGVEPLWDTWWMLSVLIGLLAIEWALRKKWQLL